jgi:predicted amidohydrolase
LGVAWIITPELCICGYSFVDQIGTDWILPQPDAWMRHLMQQIAQRQVTVFLSHPERQAETGSLYNSVLVIGAIRLQSNGTRPDPELYRCRERDRDRWAAASLLSG